MAETGKSEQREFGKTLRHVLADLIDKRVVIYALSDHVSGITGKIVSAGDDYLVFDTGGIGGKLKFYALAHIVTVVALE